MRDILVEGLAIHPNGQALANFLKNIFLVPGIHPKSKSPESPQNYSLRMRKLLTLLCGILSQRAKALNVCQSVVKKCHKCPMNMFLLSDSLFLQHFWDIFNDLRTFLQNSNAKIYALFPQFF